MKKKGTVFVGMSGGVDSSVAAYLLNKQGLNVVGVFMRCYNVDGCAERDAEDARRVAEKIGIPFYAWDFEEEYKKRVVDYMVEGYRAGLTPNPDVMCNREVKFGLFLERALKMGADYVATGHYVKLGHLTRLALLEAKDKNKDQSYFLWMLTQEQLKYCLFPIGDLLKSEVRNIAKKAGLPTAEKKDSQGICFLGEVRIEEFLKNYIPENPGKVLTLAGEVVGEHRGAHFYTIGQRHINVNLKIKNQKSKLIEDRKPMYVAMKDVAANTITMAEGDDNDALYRKEVELANINLMGDSTLHAEYSMPVWARVRYRQPLSKAMFFYDASTGRAKLVFTKPQKFVASGQSAVFYEAVPSTSLEQNQQRFRMLGGGVII